jgi:hypothetical protein
LAKHRSNQLCTFPVSTVFVKLEGGSFGWQIRASIIASLGNEGRSRKARPLPQPRTNSHASSTTSYTAKNPTQRQSSTAAMNKNSNEPKCAFANTPHNSASNSYPSQQIQQLRKLVPEESGLR